MEFMENWEEEKRSAYLYNVMATHETNILHKKLFNDLNIAAEKQAIMWEKKILLHHKNFSKQFTPDFRTRLVAKLISILGTQNMHSVLSTMKIRGMSVFNNYHSEHKHTSFNASSNLRAAIFGINDGLISNMSLILGIAGAAADTHTIIVAGTAGLLAGACSMGAGEYISVRSQLEIFEYQITLEKQELEEYPEEEMEELSLIYQARGVPKLEADNLAKIMIDNPQTGLNALAREELGINPDDLVSPIGAMLSSFMSFSLGACIPLLPFLLNLHFNSIYLSMGLTCCTLFLIGIILSFLTNRNPFYLGMRMLLIGCFAGAITFGIGKFLGISLS